MREKEGINEGKKRGKNMVAQEIYIEIGRKLNNKKIFRGEKTKSQENLKSRENSITKK